MPSVDALVTLLCRHRRFAAAMTKLCSGCPRAARARRAELITALDAKSAATLQPTGGFASLTAWEWEMRLSAALSLAAAIIIAIASLATFSDDAVARSGAR